MSKPHKRRKSKRSLANVPPLTFLRPRLDKLLGNTALAEKEVQDFKGALDAVCQGLQPEDFLPILLRAYHSAPMPGQACLDEVAPIWLGEREYVDALLKLVRGHNINQQSHDRALAWLATTGIGPPGLQEIRQQTPFYQAHMYADDSQGVINIFWYTDGRRQKVQGMIFLIDFNPPWEGAVKDITICTPRSPERAKQKYVDLWEKRGTPLRSISDTEAKREVLQCLEVNRLEGIRLPRDLVQHRHLFVECILSLPDTPETPRFTVEDIDELSHTGESVEALRDFEQRVGRRVRMKDGKEILVMGNPFDEDEW